MKKASVAAASAMALAFTTVAPAMAEMTLYEEMRARQEEKLIFTSPIAGIENKHWFNYRINVIEAKKELSSDLRRASDTEDLRDAWDEYAHELKHERKHYVKKMEKRGYRVGQVFVG
jgi:hypothetical protein